MEPLQPLRIADIGLAPRHVLGIARVDKKHGKSPGIEELEDRNPVDAGRFHDDSLDAAFSKPVDQPMQIGREGTEAADWLRCATGILPPFLASIFLGFISNPPADGGGRAGLRYWSDS